jgi:cell wall-associated NlpC family hydrolase
MSPVEAAGIAGVWSRVQEIHAQVQAASGAPPAAAPVQGAAFAQSLSDARGALLGQIGAVAPQTPAAPPPGAQAPMQAYVPPPVATATTGVTWPGQAPVLPGSSGPIGQRIAAIARAEVGVAEAPAGSNEGSRIAQYRTATEGAMGGQPWCSYFTSWVAQQAGVPVGDRGQGLGWVPDVEKWAEQNGRWVPASSGTPAVGDLVVFDRNGDGLTDHIGVVTGVRPDGGFETVEGNSSDAVSTRSYGRGEATGFVRLVPPGV